MTKVRNVRQTKAQTASLPIGIAFDDDAAASAMPFTPTPAEVAFVNQIFTQADPQKLGLVTGEQGVKIFAGSHLPPGTLGDIWSLSDPENNGALTRRGVAIAVRLIGWAQSGETPSNELLEKGNFYTKCRKLC